MTFFTYMMRNHRRKDTAQGDLADDMYEDRESFPRHTRGDFEDWHDEIRGYLEDSGACWGCLDVFEECWEAYVKAEEDRRRNRTREPHLRQHEINTDRDRKLYHSSDGCFW